MYLEQPQMRTIRNHVQHVSTESTVTVMINHQIAWARNHICEVASGISTNDAAILSSVLSILEDATEQVRVQLRALQHSDAVADICATASEINDDMPVACRWCGNSGGKVFSMAPIVAEC